jgi:hypothetical protein
MIVALPPPGTEEVLTKISPDVFGGEDQSALASVRVAALLREQTGRIIANWVVRIANMPAFRAMPTLALDQLQDAIPELLDAVLFAIASSDPTMDAEPLDRALHLADEHGRRRARQNLAIGVVLAEYQQLRAEVWLALWREVDANPELADAPRMIQSRLNFAFGGLDVAAAEGWAEERFSASSTE